MRVISKILGSAFVSTRVRSAIGLIFGVAIFVGLPVLGWGITDVIGFVSSPARLGYIVLVVLLQVFVAIRFPGAGRTGGEGTKIVRRQRLVVFLMQAISLANCYRGDI